MTAEAGSCAAPSPVGGARVHVGVEWRIWWRSAHNTADNEAGSMACSSPPFVAENFCMIMSADGDVADSDTAMQQQRKIIS